MATKKTPQISQESSSNGGTAGNGGEVFASASLFKPATPGISCKESTEVYESWVSAGTYDEVMNDTNYRGPGAACEAVESLYPTDTRDIPLILDACCGSGLVGQKLRRQGFSRLHGVDASSGMLRMAGQKEVYKKLVCCFLGDCPLPMDPDTYDCVVMCGGFMQGHVPTAALRQLVRVVKSGGAVCLVFREVFLREVPEYRGRLEKEMADMEKEGLWTLASRRTIPNYFFHHTGVVFIFRVA
ncbi:hypothetical protein ACOMHN_043397 [Nucella lapillus]